MVNKRVMVKIFTQMCPKISVPHQCLVLTKGKLTAMMPPLKPIFKSRTFAEEPGGKGPGKEEQIDSVKMPGFVNPHSKHEEGYFTQKAHQQLEELKKKVEKPKVENTEKQE